MNLFSNLKAAPQDPIFGITSTFNQDSRDNKINLIIGYYRDETLKTPLLKSIKSAEEILLTSEKNKEYLGIEGLNSFIEHIGALVFSEALYKEHRERISGIQSVGGTGALNTIAELLKSCSVENIYISDPTWPNHRNIFENSKFKVETYPYYDMSKNKLQFAEVCRFFETLKEKSCVVLHASCHNPSGFDLNLEEWKILSHIFKKKKLIPLFDIAYQGLGDGLEKDAASIELFLKEGHEFFVAYSCAKNFGLYGERTGAAFAVSENRSVILSNFKQIARATYSNPPRHGALLVDLVLSKHELKQMWQEELSSMRNRILQLRKNIRSSIENLTGQSYPQATFGKGLFFFTGLSSTSVKALSETDGIYLTLDGRMNITGLNNANFDKVMKAIANHMKS